jgi:hypothetical protein
MSICTVTLSRQGLSHAVSPPRAARNRCGPLRIAYFGRIARDKGADLLARALKIIAGGRHTIPLTVDVYFCAAVCVGKETIRNVQNDRCLQNSSDASQVQSRNGTSRRAMRFARS